MSARSYIDQTGGRQRIIIQVDAATAARVAADHAVDEIALKSGFSGLNRSIADTSEKSCDVKPFKNAPENSPAMLTPGGIDELQAGVKRAAAFLQRNEDTGRAAGLERGRRDS